MTGKAIADKVNLQTSSTGVTATALTNTELKFGTGGAYSINIKSDNGTPQTISFTIGSAMSSTDDFATAVQAINDVSAKTGVTAQVNSATNGIVLTSLTGNDIQLSGTGNNTGAGNIAVQNLKQDLTTLGNSTALASNAATSAYVTTTGTLEFDSEKSFAITGATAQNVVAAAAAGSVASTLNNVADLNVTTFAKSTDALRTIDAALAVVNGMRARFGAIQARFESTIGNLQAISENLSASRSRIRDADFASETAKLSRSQILQQAGTAMLAQANALPQQVLQLLQG
jgi:flagellin